MIYHDISGVPQFGIAKLVNFSFNHMAGFCGRFVSTSWDLNANKKKLGEPSCNHHFLVGGFTHLEKYESQWEGLSHILWNIKKNETTNHHFRYVFVDQPLCHAQRLSLLAASFASGHHLAFNDLQQRQVQALQGGRSPNLTAMEHRYGRQNQ